MKKIIILLIFSVSFISCERVLEEIANLQWYIGKWNITKLTNVDSGTSLQVSNMYIRFNDDSTFTFQGINKYANGHYSVQGNKIIATESNGTVDYFTFEKIDGTETGVYFEDSGNGGPKYYIIMSK